MNILNLNNETKKYKYYLSAIEKDDWMEFANQIIYQTAGLNDVDVIICKVSIVDNVAKVKLAYNEFPVEGKSIYHESKFMLNEFGKVNSSYADPTSKAFQLYMYKHYGDEYYYDVLAKQIEAEEELNK